MVSNDRHGDGPVAVVYYPLCEVILLTVDLQMIVGREGEATGR